ncbi:type II secretion system protein [Ramlibacter henchirensis]|uniref:Type II secretion system protein n=1 Tax=Ramlibacter henchirensis TaxID=204072 RepID=A0A4Z0C5J2_9BURK|nr:type II secretion system protein [Ramlibacter henchirensis]TFZ05379.1 type II secretion system protein [Ramlibacter henchirensis]
MRRRGFTLIELLIVLSIMAVLLTIALPRYFQSVDRSREVALAQSLMVVRDAIDKYYSDRGRYPDSLSDLVQARYLRALPVDPVTGNADAWVVVPPPAGTIGGGSLYDLRSGAPGQSTEGRAFSEF